MRRAGLIVVATIAAGCAGQMQGSIAGSSARPVISYQQGVSSDSLRISMPDGEVFQGRVVMADQATTYGFGSVQSGGATAFGNYVGESTSGRMAAKLLSNRGRAMDCQFQYADSSGFTAAGGVGTCMIVDGERVDIVW